MADDLNTGSVDPLQTPTTPEPATNQPAVNEPTSGNLPEDSSQRTQNQFNKVLDNNRQLMEANQQLQSELERRNRTSLQQPGGVTPSPAPSPQPTQPQPPVAPQASEQPLAPNPADFIEVDPRTGDKYINETKMKTAFEEAINRSQRAETTVETYIKQQEELDQARQRAEAFGAYPELNPQNKEQFSQDMHIETRQILLDSMVNPNDYGGRVLRFKDAADIAKNRLGQRNQAPKEPEGEPPKATEDPVVEKEQQEKQERKEQAAIEADGGSTGNQASAEEQEQISREKARLHAQIRAGDDLALAKRLTQIPHKMGDEGVEQRGEG